MHAGNGSAAAAAAAIANAVKASGVVVRMEPREFMSVVSRADRPLVVTAKGFWGKHQYLTSYKGLAFYTKSGTALSLPRSAEVIVAQKFWMPG